MSDQLLFATLTSRSAWETDTILGNEVIDSTTRRRDGRESIFPVQVSPNQRYWSYPSIAEGPTALSHRKYTSTLEIYTSYIPLPSSNHGGLWFFAFESLIIFLGGESGERDCIKPDDGLRVKRQRQREEEQDVANEMM